MNNVVIVTLVAFVLASMICISLLTFTLLTAKVDCSGDDAIRRRMDLLVNYTEQKINNAAERQERINTDMESQLRILDTRIKILQGRNQ